MYLDTQLSLIYYGVKYFTFLGKNLIFLCKLFKNWPSRLYLPQAMLLKGGFSKFSALNHWRLCSRRRRNSSGINPDFSNTLWMAQVFRMICLNHNNLYLSLPHSNEQNFFCLYQVPLGSETLYKFPDPFVLLLLLQRHREGIEVCTVEIQKHFEL